MNRIVALVILCLSGILIGSCSSGSQSGEGSTSTELSGGTYRGVLPCADCEGIFYELQFQKGRQYKATSIYIGESNRPFTESGSWRIKSDTLLVLSGRADGPRRFAIQDGNLVVLDQKGREITGSLANHYILHEADTTKQKAQWKDRRLRGIDFRASGNEPFWSLDIDFDKMMRFEVLDGDSLQVAVPGMTQDTASKARLLQTKAASDSLTVALYPTGCIDSMSGQLFTHRVEVRLGDKTYRGCGNIINERYQLHDFWTLQRLNGTEITAQDTMRQRPALQFDLKNGKIYGNTGCNQLSGGLSIEGDSLSFASPITTKMACPGDMESRFLDAFAKVNRYDISQQVLRLLHDRDTLMVFHRTE